MRGDDHLKIGRAVAFAMATQKVDAAEFDVLTKDIYYRRTDADLLHSANLFNNFIVECPDAFAGLTRLHLQNLRFGESDIPNILATCKRLESLRKLPVLHVEHARLVELIFAYPKFSTVELGCLPKLRRMTLHRWIFDNLDNPLILGHVPQLSKLTLAHAFIINRTLKLSQLLVNVPSISDLHLDFQSEKVWVLPECPKVLAPVLGKLRRVNLNNLPEECDITWTMFLLEATPSLEELCITVWDHKCQLESQKSYSQKTDVKWEPSTADFKHNNLSRLTIYGFQPNDNFMGYVRRVTEAAENIREVSLHDRKVC
uniref:At1g61320/AtMIF1 LRR domain-containing protein n=2 Tax=Triticum urartu TaxID=4572 RepID=A0A8R7RHD2_TRIUA